MLRGVDPNPAHHAVAELERCIRKGAEGVGELSDKGRGLRGDKDDKDQWTGTKMAHGERLGLSILTGRLDVCRRGRRDFRLWRSSKRPRAAVRGAIALRSAAATAA